MKYLNMTKLAAGLACLVLSSLSHARPLETQTAATLLGHATGKRVILWDWTLTRDYASSPGIQAMAASLLLSPQIHSVANWNTWRPSEVPSSIPFRPMVRTPAQLSGDEWNNLLAVIKSQPSAFVYFYNEPERQGISVADAVGAWRTNMLPLRSNQNARLVGPACASDDAGSAWHQAFMSALSDGEKPDYTGVHFYSAPSQSASESIAAAKTFLNAKYSAYGTPLIVSEIASTSRSADVVTSFTHEMAAWMDAQSMVAEYGFFGATRGDADSFVSPAAQLLDANGSWTTLGAWLAGL